MVQQRAFAVAHLTNAPAAFAMPLQQKHVVVVVMRADAATGGGIADHHVVDAPVGEKAKLFEQFGDFRDELVDGLHQ
ncbi:hypothetical protein D3C77_646980 [compost metagenome]